MGLMTVAGRLRLGLAALEKTGNLISRRFRSLAAPVSTGYEGEFEPNTEKRIYLCFLQLISNNTQRFDNSIVNGKQIVLPIQWKWDSSSDYKDETLVDEVAHKKFSFYNEYSNMCSTCGSRVLLPCGIDTLHTCSLDTSMRPLKIEVLSAQEPHAKPVKNIKHQLIWGEVDGKIYRLWNHFEMFDLHPSYSEFQVSDPGFDFHPISLSWESLLAPPFIRSQEGGLRALFLDSAKKIIGWNEFERRYFCFDTNYPEKGWRYLGDSLPFGGKFYKPFLVYHHHPDFGYFHLMFQYDPSTYQISAFFISKNFDTFKPIHTCIKLPDIIRESDPGYEEFLYQQPHADFSFVDLGNKRVGLVLHKCENRDGNGKEPGSVLLVAFEYEIATYVRKSKPAIDIESVLIKTCLFQYPTKHLREPAGSVSHYRMNGAFLL